MFISLLVGALIIGSIYGLIGLGYSLIYRASNLINFAQGEFFMIGSFIGLTFYRILGLPFAVSLILTIIVMFFFGILFEKGIIRNVLKKSQGYFIVLATIALSIFLQNLAMLIWGSRRLEFPSIFGSWSGVEIAGITIQGESFLIIGIAIICMIFLIR